MNRRWAAAALVLLGPLAGPGHDANAGPPLQVPPARLRAALHCPDRLSGERDPVLFVHGLSLTGASAWSWNYGAVLPEQGYDVCLLDLPGFATVDIQVSTEYVVDAIRSMARRSGRHVDVVTFSQGALEARWALTWWPDLRHSVDDLVLLAGGPNHGTTPAGLLCSVRCVAALWQSRPGSAFIHALGAGDPTPGSVSYTNVYSGTDELVFLAGGAPDPWTAAAAIDGAENVRVQDLCPGRPVEHVQHTYDAEVHALVLDALEHPGPADPARVGSAACTQVTMPGVEPTEAAARTAEIAAGLVQRTTANQVGGEPALAGYARR
jgi:triacylglycerol lipase